jgi:anti-anti-sigma factor
MESDGATWPPARVAVDRHEDARIVSLYGDHDVSTVDLVRAGLADARMGTGGIVVDLTDTTFIDSRVVAAFIEANRADNPPRLRVIAPADTPPRRLLTFAGLEKILPIYDRLEDALADAAAG